MLAQLSTYAICYESLRIYRLAVVQVARERLQQAHPRDWQELVKRPFKKTWDDMVRNAHERRLTGEVGSELTDDLDYLGVNQLPSLFESLFDEIFPMQPGTGIDKQVETRRRQAILGWARECRGMRDPVAHNSEVDLNYEDAFRLVDSARRILEQLGADTARAREQLQELAEGLQDPTPITADEPPDARPPLEGYLPDAIAPVFVGRQDELDALATWLRGDRARRWALMGAGGTGKSAIAYEFAERVREEAPEPFAFVVWLSAKRRRFVEGQATDVPSPDFTDLASALDFLLLRYGQFEPDADRGEDRADLVLALLDVFPALIVLDDLDTLEGQAEDAIEFFTVRVPATRSRVLVTSRRQILGLGATTTVVRGFQGEAGREFVRSRVGLFGLDQGTFTTTRIERILRVTDGSPLFIEDLLRLCAVGVPIDEATKQWTGDGATSGREVRAYALRRELEILGDNASEVIVAAAVPERSLALAELRAITGLPEERLHAAIRELQRLFLMPTPGFIEGEDRFELNSNTRQLVRTVWEDSDKLRRAVNGFRSLSDESVAPTNQQRRIGAHVTQAVALVRQGRHVDAERTLLAGLSEYPNEVGLIAQLGWVYRSWKPEPRFSDARAQFLRARELRCRRPEMYWHWSSLEVQSLEYEAAASAAEAGLELISENHSLLFAAGRARSLLGRQLLGELQPAAAGQLMSARAHLKASIRDPGSLRSTQDRRTQAQAYRSLVLTLVEFLRFRGGEEEVRDMPRLPDLAREALMTIERWSREHPDDPQVEVTRNTFQARLESAAAEAD